MSIGDSTPKHKEAQNEVFGEITVEVIKLGPNTFYLKQDLGSAELSDGTKITISTIVSDGSLYLSVGEGLDERYMVGMIPLTRKALGLIETKRKENP